MALQNRGTLASVASQTLGIVTYGEILARLLQGTPNPITAAATAVAGVRNTVDGTSGAYTVTLPAPGFVGQPMLIERIDTTTVNTVTVQGAASATIEGSTTRAVSMLAVGVAYESTLFIAETLTSWSIAGAHKTAAWINAYIAQQIAVAGSPVQTALAQTYPTKASVGSAAYDSVLVGPLLEQAYASDSAMLAAAQAYTDSQNLAELLRVNNRPGSYGNNNALATGQSTLDRNAGLIATLALVSGEMAVTYFQSALTQTVNNLRFSTGNTAAGATPTLIRVGLFQVAADGSLTLLGSTANTTSLFGSTYSANAVALSAGVALTAGVVYALGILVVSTATMPTTVGVNAAGGVLAEAGQSPRLCSRVASLTDLPATVTAANVLTSSRSIYLAVTA